MAKKGTEFAIVELAFGFAGWYGVPYLIGQIGNIAEAGESSLTEGAGRGGGGSSYSPPPGGGTIQVPVITSSGTNISSLAVSNTNNSMTLGTNQAISLNNSQAQYSLMGAYYNEKFGAHENIYNDLIQHPAEAKAAGQLALSVPFLIDLSTTPEAIAVDGQILEEAQVESSAIQGVGEAATEDGNVLEKPLYRYMSEGELNAVKETGYLRGGNPGPTFWTDSSYKSAENAADKLSLPDTPQYRVEFQITNSPSIEGGTRIESNFNGLGGGREYWSNDPVQVNIINAQPIGLR